MHSNQSFSIIHFLISDSPLPASPLKSGEPLKTIPTETQLTLTLMKAVQELSTEVETLKAQVSGSN